MKAKLPPGTRAGFYERQVYERLWEKAIREYEAMKPLEKHQGIGFALARGAYLSTLEACIECLLLSPAHEEGEDYDELLSDLDRMVQDEVEARKETDGKE